jgi:hypothetical protein
MKTHRELFTQYLRDPAIRPTGKVTYRFRDWRDDREIVQCLDCEKWGLLGDEVRFLGDTEIRLCDNCIVNVWGWYQCSDNLTDRMALATEAMRGQETYFLLVQAKKFKQSGDPAQLIEWGYE